VLYYSISRFVECLVSATRFRRFPVSIVSPETRRNRAAAYQHSGNAFPVDPHETEVRAGVITATGETQRQPVERASVREVRFKLDRAGRVIDRPVDRRPARVVQRRGVHAIASHTGGTHYGDRDY